MTIRKRTTIWLGDEDQKPGDLGDFYVHSEDSMVAIEARDRAGNDVEVFIQPNLFLALRRVMDSLERAEP